MSFEDTDDLPMGMNAWSKFLDCFSLVPKYERVKNYIEFIHEKKIQKLKSMLPESTLKKFMQNKSNTMQSVRFADLELLRQFEQNKKSLQQTRDERPTLIAPTKDEEHVLGLKEEVKMMAKELDI